MATPRRRTLKPADPATVFPFFLATWAALAVASFVFFQFNRNAALKRKLWPVFTIGIAILFIAFAWLMGLRDRGLYFIVPAVALITWLNIRFMKFCDACGRTLYPHPPFIRYEFCPSCGGKLIDRAGNPGS